MFHYAPCAMRFTYFNKQSVGVYQPHRHICVGLCILSKEISMTRVTPASNILVAAIIAIVFGLIAGLIGGGIAANTQLISLVAIFSFVSAVLSPWVSQSIAAQRAKVPKTSPRARTQSAPAQHHTPASTGQNPDGSDQVTLYVGNLPFKTNEQNVEETFSEFGHVFAVRLVKDRRTGKKKGYGFVEMSAQGADEALNRLNDSEYEGRTLKVRFANTERKD